MTHEQRAERLEAEVLIESSANQSMVCAHSHVDTVHHSSACNSSQKCFLELEEAFLELSIRGAPLLHVQVARGMPLKSVGKRLSIL